MKQSLLTLLALAFCLSACAPAASAPQSEVPAAVTTETAPAEESGQTAAAACAGNIRGNGDLQQDGALRYSIGYTDPSEGEQKFRVLVLDCDTGKQTSLYTLEEPAQTVSKPFVVNGTVYVFTDKTMYQIPAAGGEARKVDLSAFFYPTSMDDTAGYSFSYDDSVNNFLCTRLDLQTGELSQVNLPAQTQEIWALNEPRIFLCRLVTEVPLPSVEEGEIYAAAMQNAICEYGWYDLATGDFQKVAEEPYYGAEQSDGTKRRREFKGLAGGRLYFVWRMVDEESLTRSAGIESCALDGTDWQSATDLPAGSDAVWTLEQNDALRWIVGENNGFWVYDVADGQTYTDCAVSQTDGWAYALTGNDRVLLSLDPDLYGDQYPGGYAMEDMDDFLAGRTDWMPLELCGEQIGAGTI